MPRVLIVDRLRPEPAHLAEAARVLRGGGLVAFPTETVYGLGANAFDDKAVMRVFSAKGRPLGHPLIAHVEGEARARTLARSWPDLARRLSEAFWPGPLTLVVDRGPRVPDVVSGGGDSVAVRAPAHPVARGLIEAFGDPIAAPSANRHQELSPTTAAHVVKQLGDAVDLVLDSGPCEAGIESTVVDVRGSVPKVLRPGTVSLVQLRAVLSDLAVTTHESSEGATRASPGMGVRHYAPRAQMQLAESLSEAREIALGLSALGTSAGIVAYEEMAQENWPADCALRVLSRIPEDYGHALYSTLHDLDEAGVKAIVVVRVPKGDAWWAIADRLQRGAA